ncbi:MAG: putative ABC transporter substrate binding protein [Parcubacteria group bacterium Gr01-1014_2]|nr:MAG: putative ABC transporter substrate binding protein [Parcubacteria group bacterium Gr01-1014_2]
MEIRKWNLESLFYFLLTTFYLLTLADDLEFLYSGGLGQKPSKKESFGKKTKNLLKKYLKSFLPEKKRIIYLAKLLSKRERYIILGLSLVIIGSIFAILIGYYFNITEAKPDFGGEFTEGLIGEPRFINPLLLQTDTDRDLAQLIYSGLLKNDGQGNFISDLAESFSISDDGLVYRFNLRKNIKWHDGINFSADDIIFTVKIAQNQDFASPQRINWQGVETVKIDDLTLEFRLKNPYAQFINNLSLGIIPSHLWKEIKAGNFILSELNLKPIGTGPYKFFKLKKDRLGRITSYELAANENYYLDGPFIESINFNFYTSEEDLIQAFNLSGVESLAGISPNNLSGLRFPGKVKINELKIPRYFAVFFNQNQSEVLSDKNVRLALAHSVNKDKIIESIYGRGFKVDSPILPEIFDDFENSVKKYDYNPDFVRQILENSGWQDKNGDGIREKDDRLLEIQLVVPLRKDFVAIGGELKKDWEAVGMKIDLITASVIELQQNYIQPRTYQMLLFGEVLNIEPDPFSFWHSSQKKDPGLNLALYDASGADKLLEEARQSLNPVIRANKYNDFQNLVIEDLPAIFLYSPYYIYPQAKKIKGFEINLMGLPSERFVNVAEWYIETKRVRK